MRHGGAPQARERRKERNHVRWLMAFATASIFAATSVARADDGGYFPAGTWTFTGYGSYIRNFTGERAVIGAGTVGVGYYLVDNFALNAELSGYHNDQHGPDADIFAGDLLIRHHLFHSGRFSFFLDGVAGVAYADHRTPYYGTYFNFILEGGAGVTFELFDNIDLIAGVRYFHLSNAHLEGPDHNPSINGTQGYIGLMVKF